VSSTVKTLPTWKSLIFLAAVMLSPLALWSAPRLINGPGAHARLATAVDGRDAIGVRLAIADGAEVNRADVYGDTALTRAATFAEPWVLVELLAGGADPDGAPDGRLNPLMLALTTGNLRNAAILLEAGADPDRTWRGIVPLVVATYREDDRAVQLLLGAGANPNGTPGSARRPLIQAIENPDAPASTVELLLRAGADPDAADAQGRTARQVAIRLGRPDANALLSRHASR
jgi:uncharacterized protein